MNAERMEKNTLVNEDDTDVVLNWLLLFRFFVRDIHVKRPIDLYGHLCIPLLEGYKLEV
jgi:hypothetical protein